MKLFLHKKSKEKLPFLCSTAQEMLNSIVNNSVPNLIFHYAYYFPMVNSGRYNMKLFIHKKSKEKLPKMCSPAQEMLNSNVNNFRPELNISLRLLFSFD